MTPRGLWLVLLVPTGLSGQGWRVDAQLGMRSAAVRGLQVDTVARDALAPGASTFTTDGYAAFCPAGAALCTYYRPGPVAHAAPLQAHVAADVWGFGVRGLRLRVNARHVSDLAEGGMWPATSPRFQLVEGHAEYARRTVTVRLGRTVLSSRLGWHGLDGVQGEVRLAGGRMAIGAWGGWGLAQAATVPATSAAVNPLAEYQPRDRQLIAGGDVAWRSPSLQGRVVYQREVDPAVDYFLSERIAADADWRVVRGVSLNAGAEYDLDAAVWGSADAALSVHVPGGARSSVGVRRYRPYFPLWTVWGAFSPSPYSAVFGSLDVPMGADVSAWARAERYWFDPSDARTPLVTTEDAGWRWQAGAGWRVVPGLRLEGQGHAAFGPGAASMGFDARIGAAVHAHLDLTLHGGRLVRPLELRYHDIALWQGGGDVRWRLHDRLTATGGLMVVDETRDRPDAAAVRWSHLRAHLGIRMQLGSGADRTHIPPAVLAMPESR